jgi:hypothetical protein
MRNFPAKGIKFFTGITIKSPEFLDTIFQDESDGLNKGALIADHCIRGKFTNEKEELIDLIFVLEYQDYHLATFSERMDNLYFRAQKRFNSRAIIPFVIFTGKAISKTTFMARYGPLKYEFICPSFELKKAKEEMLICHKNPFANIVLASYYRYITRNSGPEKTQLRLDYFNKTVENVITKFSVNRVSLIKYCQLIGFHLEISRETLYNLVNEALRRANMTLLTEAGFNEWADKIFTPGYIAQVKAQVKAEGRAEGRAETTLVVRYLKQNMPIAEIASLTGLKEYEILTIKKYKG